MFARAVNKSAVLQQDCGIQDRQERGGWCFIGILYEREGEWVNDEKEGELQREEREVISIKCW